MIKKLSLLVATLVFSIAALADDNGYVLGVDGLACPFCAYGIEKRLNRIDGVTDVQVDVGESVVHVTMQEGKTLTEARASQAVDEAGFTLRSFSEAEVETGGNDAQ
ncbi:heavy-metal-associated domain-containing protein [Marinobacter sp. SS13-12]|uniref:heavy-metal-associated domain-containing protein n=1 Tax=Marinobacter sp. SS13-12 TaxID=3050451 RepID=UPI0025531AF3|nr:heavy-metal-associated domain-containing protein [Marinobacter sp. SS13-12]MDK8462329.1 heavy-metal-associated domain-containing protein [Marinobacter sp. SS13-12]